LVSSFGAPASVAMPGWTASLGGVPTGCLYNAVTLGSGSVDLFSTFPPHAGSQSGSIILAGNYTAELQGSVFGAAAALSQTGTIPSDSKSLYFIGGAPGGGDGGLTVSLNGSPVPITVLGHTSTGPNNAGYDTYGLSVSAWAGQTVNLQFATTGAVLLDNITFSPVALAPEPSTYALFGVGAAALLWFHRRKP
jgi:PEP-CTERM motif